MLIQTERLILRPATTADVPSFHELCVEAAVRRYLFDDRSISAAEAAALLEASARAFAVHRYGLWLLFQKGSTELAGFAGLLEGDDAPSLVFAVHPRNWRKGIATEAALAVLRYAQSALELERVVADVDEPNAGSVRILEKLGMRRIRQAVVDGRPLLYFELDGPISHEPERG